MRRGLRRELRVGAGGDPGLRLLQEALVWGSTLDQTVVTESASYSTSFGSVHTAGQPDPWGGTAAFAVSGNVIASYQPGLRWSTTGLSAAPYHFEVYHRIPPAYQSDSARALARINAPSGSALGCNLQAPSDVDTATPAEGRNIPGAVGSSPIRRGWSRKLPDYWIRARYTIQGNRNTLIDWLSGQVATQDGTVRGVVAAPTLSRRSVSAQANLATGSAATITQGTVALRPNVDPDPWSVDGEDVLFTDGYDGYLAVSEIAAALSGASVSWSFSAVLEMRKKWRFFDTGATGGAFFRLIGATASLAIEQTAAGLRVVRVDDAAASTTATLPVEWIEHYPHVLTLTCSGSTIQLFVDGRAVGSAQAIGAGAATFTSARIMGASHVALGEWSAWGRALTATEVQQQASTLARRRGFSTGPVQLWFGTGNSNSDHTADNLWEQTDAQQVAHGRNLFAHARNEGNPASLGTWGPARGLFVASVDMTSTTDEPSVNRMAFSYAIGFLRTRPVNTWLMHYSRGGVDTSYYLPIGGSEWAGMIAHWDANIARLEAAGLTWVAAGYVPYHHDGNNDANANAQTTRIDTIAAAIEARYGVTLPRIHLHRICAELIATYPSTALLRTNETTWEAVDPARRILVDVDGLPIRGDGVHWDNPAVAPLGERLGTPSNLVRDL